MARFVGRRTVLVDVTLGPAAIAEGLGTAAERLRADLVVFVDVGGDALGHGGEPGLASPLCDAVMLAAAALLGETGRPVLGGVFGPGCDGELSATELFGRIAEVASAGGLAGIHGLTPAVADRIAEAVAVVPTEASAQAVRCFRGEHGTTTIRGGRRSVALSPLGAMTVYFDVGAAMRSAARLAFAVRDAGTLVDANARLHELGIRTELDFERANVER